MKVYQLNALQEKTEVIGPLVEVLVLKALVNSAHTFNRLAPAWALKSGCHFLIAVYVVIRIGFEPKLLMLILFAAGSPGPP